MKLFTVVFEKDGEQFATFTVHAGDETGACAACEAWFRDNPEHDPRCQRSDLTIRAAVTREVGPHDAGSRGC
jgi:hypothetical protein